MSYIRLYRRIISCLWIVLSLAGAVLCSSGCSKDRNASGVLPDPAVVMLRARISIDPSEIDTYVTRVRLLGFGRDDGTLACNTLYTALSPSVDGTVALTEKIRGTGVRMYVIANETDEMTAKLDFVYNERDFLALDVVSKIEFTPGWEPVQSSPFLMSDIIEVDLPVEGEQSVNVNASLKRMQAKLTLSVKNEYSATQTEGAVTYKTKVSLSNVRLENVPLYQSAVPPLAGYGYQYLAAGFPMSVQTGGVYETDTWEDTYETVYIPEHIVAGNDPDTATSVCFTAERSFVNIANPLDVKVVTSKHYVVPIQSPLGLGEGVDYSVRRNNHYNIQCRITGWDEGPIVTAEVVPWSVHKVEVDFDTPVFEIEPREVEMVDGRPVVRGSGGYVVYAFKLKGPKGAIWRATISNGLDFDLFNTGEYVWSGRVDKDKFALLKVVSTKDFMMGPLKTTDLIIRVNEKEVYRIENITLQPAL